MLSIIGYLDICKIYIRDFPGGPVVRNPPANTGDPQSIPGEGNDNPLQCSCLGNPMGRGAWWVQSMGL